MTESISLSGNSYLSMMQSTTSETTSQTASDSSSQSTQMSTDEILNELRQDGLSSSMTAQDIADEYGISLSKAQQILDELKGDDNGVTVDSQIPEDSTVSFHV